ncbi:MAG: hypothetical protein GC160_29460 [Acidobacteria bacterium]|nr:hypothetical protein [Acidobacteriota bacterium]
MATAKKTTKSKSAKAAATEEAAPKAAAPKKAAKKAAAPAKEPSAPPPPPPPEEPAKKATKKAAKKGGRGRLAPEPPPEPMTGADLQAEGTRPLDGVRVLELSMLPAAAEAGLWLARFGADVVRLEHPTPAPPLVEEPELFGRPAFDVYAHRGKKSLSLDWKKPGAVEAVARLAARADIILCDWADKDLKPLGLSPSTTRDENPRLIWVALSGYGRSGPLSKFSGRDINFLALSGLLGLIGGVDGLPALPGVRLGDTAGGSMPAVIGALLALLAREKTKKGQLVDVSQLDGIVGLLGSSVADYAATRRKPHRGREALYGRYACYNIYPVRNGRWVALGALEPKAWATLCKAIDREAMIPEQFAGPERQQVLVAELTRVFQRKDIREWSEVLDGKDVCLTEVRSLGDAVQDPHLLERQMMLTYRRPDGSGSYPATGVYPQLSATPGALGEESRPTGADSEEILAELGLSKKDIADLLD